MNTKLVVYFCLKKLFENIFYWFFCTLIDPVNYTLALQSAKNLFSPIGIPSHRLLIGLVDSQSGGTFPGFIERHFDVRVYGQGGMTYTHYTCTYIIL